MQLNPGLGVAILEAFWVSGDALRLSARGGAQPRRGRPAATGTVTFERYAVPVFELEAPLRSGEGVRVARMDVAPSAGIPDGVQLGTEILTGPAGSTGCRRAGPRAGRGAGAEAAQDHDEGQAGGHGGQARRVGARIDRAYGHGYEAA